MAAPSNQRSRRRDRRTRYGGRAALLRPIRRQ